MSIKVAPEVRSNVYTGTNGDMSVAIIEYSADSFKQGDLIVLAELPAGAELLEFMIGSDSIPAGVSAHLGLMYQDGSIEFIHPAITIATSVNEKVTLLEPFTLQQNATFVAKVESSGTTVNPTPTLTSFTVDLSDNDIPVGDMATAVAIDPRPVGASLSTVTWKSSDDTKATIQPNGNINGIAAGVVTITGTDTATSVEATAQITISASAVTTQSITVADADVIAAVTFTGQDGNGSAMVDSDAIDHVTLSLTGTTTGLTNGDNVTVHIVASAGYDISGHGSAFDIQVPVKGLTAVTTPGKTYNFSVTLGGSAATPKLGLDHTGVRVQGSIRPDTWGAGAATFELFSVNKSNGALILKSSDSSKWDNSDSLEVEIEGHTQKLTVSWYASQGWYSLSGQSDLYDYFLQRIGTNEVVGVNIVAPVATNP